MVQKRRTTRRKRHAEIRDYDTRDTSTMIDLDKPLTFRDLGLDLPKQPPTQVVSIRLPSGLLNQLKAFASARDVPYQALIKLLLAESLAKRRAA
jgi:predicted DNA binding CopG/RHH family protein